MVAISLGDPSGIGPEVTAAALGDGRVRRALVPLLFGDRAQVPAGLDEQPPRSPARPARAAFVAVTALSASDRRPGRPTRAGGRAQLAYVLAAIDAAQAGAADAICTAPVSKEQITRAGIPFVGHTEVLAERFGREVLMLMDGPRLKVALATNHLALKDVPGALRQGRLAAQLSLLSTSLARVLGRPPRIAVCGLNPHAGEGGVLGREELEIIRPAILRARRRGVRCEGPFAADGLFARAGRLPYDAVLAMYHDQGLVAAKALDFEATVNVTLGLPVPRTSPDHGVAYDLAGKRTASAEPMIAALLAAARLARAPGRKTQRAQALARRPRRRAPIL